MKLTQSQQKKCAHNLATSFEILDAIYELKFNQYKSIFPDKPDKEILKILYKEIIDRKENAWKSLTS